MSWGSGLAIVAGLLLCVVGLLKGASLLVNDLFVPHVRLPKGPILAVFAHPDDEVMVAGSLAKWKKQGHPIHLLYLTHGEDGPTGGLCEQNELKQLRKEEIANVATHLLVDSYHLLDFPDRHLHEVDPCILQSAVEAQIERIAPMTLIGFDTAVGLYGHLDHVAAGVACCDAIKAHPEIKHLQMTLCNRMIALALKVSQTFRTNHVASRLPRRTHRESIAMHSRTKKHVVHAHRSQWQVMNDVQPLGNKMPHWLYYRIFSNEYFYEVKR